MEKTPADDDSDDLLDAMANVGAYVAKGLDAVGRPDLSAKVRKGEVGLRTAAEARRQLPAVMRAVAEEYETGPLAKLGRILRKKGIVRDWPSRPTRRSGT